MLDDYAEDIESGNLGIAYSKARMSMCAAPSVEPEKKDRDCASCKHSNNGECAYTEECHACMWESKYEKQVEPERKPGKWLKRTDKTKELYGWYQCSQCGAIIGEPVNYCSECGSYNGGTE